MTTARLTHQATEPAVALARHWVTGFAGRQGMTTPARSDMAVAVSEAVTNTVRHAYGDDARGDVVVDAASDGEWLTVRVADDGRGGTEDAGSGAGVRLMRELADRLELSSGHGGVGTVVLMEFPIPRSVPGPPRTRGAHARRPTGPRRSGTLSGSPRRAAG
ncbi:MAG TPA: ATP-binding protein [Solirubrobacteraceae bacterium]